MKEDAAAMSYLHVCLMLPSSLSRQKKENIWRLLADHKHEREMPPLKAMSTMAGSKL